MPASPDSEQLEAAGSPARFRQRAAAAAHELNNILTVIRTYTHFARQDVSHEQRTRDLRVVAAAAERGTTLTDWLASVAERTPSAPDELSAREFVSIVVARLQSLVLPRTSIETSQELPDTTFRGNAARLKHVIISLVLAANQLLAGGSFKLSGERRVVVAGQNPALEPGSYFAILIECRALASAGPPIEDASLREQLAGSMAFLRDLLDNMNGALELTTTGENELGFALYLRPGSGAPRVAKPTGTSGAYRGATVLLVEDDAAIRAGMQRTLVKAGCSVLEASDGEAAQELMSDIGRSVDLVVSDVVLPRAGGVDLFEWTKARYPKMPFLLVSGREREGEAKASELGVPFLGKPFYPAEFLAAVGRALSSAPVSEQQEPLRERPVVVIVDDDADIRDSFQRLLAECDFETHIAKSALHALQILSQARVDAIVSDQFMPGLDGIGLLELVSQRFPACIRILCTGHPASDVVMDAVNRGRVHRVLTKTMHAVALRDEIERAVLEVLRARRSAAEAGLELDS